MSGHHNHLIGEQLDQKIKALVEPCWSELHAPFDYWNPHRDAEWYRSRRIRDREELVREKLGRKMKRLDFGFLKHDDILEARVEAGFYHISPCKNGFHVSACVAHECYKVGEFSNIYDALDAANKHYSGE